MLAAPPNIEMEQTVRGQVQAAPCSEVTDRRLESGFLVPPAADFGR